MGDVMGVVVVGILELAMSQYVTANDKMTLINLKFGFHTTVKFRYFWVQVYKHNIN
jgi:hypothetical protein